MYNLLIFESDSIFKIGIANRLEKENKHITIETASSISKVLQKSLFMASEQKDGYDLFIVSVNKQEDNVISFIQYVIKNKPELPILIFSYETNDWLLKQGINCKQNLGRYIKKVSCWQDIQQEVKKLLADPVILSSSSTREINPDFSLPSRRVSDI
ncbi:hypothetical protein ACFP1I_06020 [Dyadobacter subterraneus]|uniref:Response regulator receiver domain-containing protein n=1 Tax=Dyadobacter subterraneus TaxID=2773304 RepID=A0ABR9WJH3_9BACT|nr:hypothetical protein [Dyadobacter subterraneus]MBE9464314.1 hypothetical protein [Dyadobacter subterraneus]